MTLPNSDEFYQLNAPIVETQMMINKKFETNENGIITMIELLDRPIQKLKALSFVNNEPYIITYLPTRKEKIAGSKTNPIKVIDYENSAFFITINKLYGRRIFPHSDDYLNSNFNINVMTIGQVRWEPEDVQKFLKEKNISEPKELFYLHSRKMKQYVEFENISRQNFHILWCIGTYFHILFNAYPYYDLLGTKRAGKTKVLEYLKLTAFNPVMSPDFTGASIFRLISLTCGTILLDESEQFRNQKSESAQHVRTLLNQGFLNDQYVYRINKDTHEPESFDLFSPKALAHINTFDDVLGDRCIQNIMTRSTSKIIQDSYPNEHDLDFQTIRNLSYRIFLDYANEINSLKQEALKILDLPGREKLLWTPIVTLAIFFENHGIADLVKSILNLAYKSSKDRQISDESDNLDYRIVRYLETQVVEKGWKTISELYNGLVLRASDFEIKIDYYSRHKLTDTLTRLGLKKERKESGISWLISREEINELKTRLGMVTETTETTATTASNANSTLDAVLPVENEGKM